MRNRVVFGALAGSGLVLWLSGAGGGRQPGPVRVIDIDVARQHGGLNISADGSVIAATGQPSYSLCQALQMLDLRTGETTDATRFLPPGLAVMPRSLALSGDGRFVAFVALDQQGEPPSPQIMVFDRQNQSVEVVPSGPHRKTVDVFLTGAALSHDGSVLVFSRRPGSPTRSDGLCDVLVWDRRSGRAERIVAWPDGHCGGARPTVSGDGRFVAFLSRARLAPEDTNECDDIYVYDRESQAIQWVSLGSDDSQGSASWIEASISPCGRYVAFCSKASNLVGDDTNGTWDIFVHDHETRSTGRVSVVTGGGQANGPSFGPCISRGGRYVAFESDATNLAPGAQEGVRNIYRHDSVGNCTVLISGTRYGRCGDKPSVRATMSGDGRSVLFVSNASNLAGWAATEATRIFLWEAAEADGVGSEVMALSNGPMDRNEHARY